MSGWEFLFFGWGQQGVGGGGVPADIILRRAIGGEIPVSNPSLGGIELRGPGVPSNIAFRAGIPVSASDTIIATDSPTGGAVYLKSASDSVMAFDAISQQLGEYNPNLVANIPVASGPFGLAIADGLVWVAGYSASRVDVISPDSRTVTQHIQLADGSGPTGVVYDGNSVWISQAPARQLSRLSTSRFAVSGQEPLESYPRRLAFDGRDLWTPNNVNGAAGFVPISVVNPGPGGGTSNVVPLSVTGIDVGPLPS